MATPKEVIDGFIKNKNQGSGSNLDHLLAMENPVAERMYFRDQDVWLDGYRFVRCRFDNCTLYIRSGQFEMDHCVIDRSSTKINYFDPARKIVRLFMNAYAPLSANMAGWGPEFHDDGTLSIRSNKV